MLTQKNVDVELISLPFEVMLKLPFVSSDALLELLLLPHLRRRLGLWGCILLVFVLLLLRGQWHQRLLHLNTSVPETWPQQKVSKRVVGTFFFHAHVHIHGEYG